MATPTKAPALPDLRLWMPGGTFESPPDRWDKQIARSDARIRDDEFPRGAAAVLRVLEAHVPSGDGWVSLDTIMAETGQRAVHSRIAELRRRGAKIEWNGCAGGRSRYRLIPRVETPSETEPQTVRGHLLYARRRHPR